MLQLHVWGPAFDLPSIDPHCLAAIAYLSQTVPHAEWELDASSNPTLSPTRELPALRDDSIWVGGFQNIVAHLGDKSGGQWDLDRACNSQGRADVAACVLYLYSPPHRVLAISKVNRTFSYTSFLETRAQTLVDLSLYVSSENYHALTRPAYSRILQWPNTWLLPPRRRAAAKARTDYLSFSALDLDSSDVNEKSKKPQLAAGTEIPRVLQTTTRRTVTSLVKQPQHAARFRLETLADSCLEPLAQLLQGKYYLLSEDQMTSLDCLALGYLSLALVPEAPQSWLAQIMKSRYPRLCHYVEDLSRDCFGVNLQTDRGKDDSPSSRTKLPWRTPSDNDSPQILTRIRSSLENLPYIGSLYEPESLQQSTQKTHEELSRFPVVPTTFLAFATSLITLGGWVLFTGDVPSFPSLARFFAGRQRRQRLNDMGEAGAMLGAINHRQSLT
ncbi:MAG: hypothetical protein Q9220_006535 [cf. Caloplaca sp. 1 TL-2023]